MEPGVILLGRVPGHAARHPRHRVQCGCGRQYIVRMWAGDIVRLKCCKLCALEALHALQVGRSRLNGRFVGKKAPLWMRAAAAYGRPVVP